MGMNQIILAAGKKAKGPRMESGICQLSIRGFMDDLTVTTTTHVQARWVLEELGEPVPAIEDNPIKCLGKWFDQTLTVIGSIHKLVDQAEEWLKRIQKSELPWKFKVWVYQYGMLPKRIWLLTLYELPFTTVEAMEGRINKHLRKWLGIPPSFTSIGLYIRSGQLQLPNSSVVEEFAKCRLVNSKDRKVSKAGIEIQTGRKWSAEEVVENAETSLKLRDNIGNPCIGRQGLGTSHFQQWNKANIKEKRDMVQKATREREDEVRKSRGVELGGQREWTKWRLPQRRLTWAEVWRMEPYRISCLLRSVFDTLPTPTSLCLYGLKEDLLCKLCGARGTLSHILSGCKTALTQGRYRWRHDKVLQAFAQTVDQERQETTTQNK
ncbi:uncharacterized protein LOC117100821 [Anneissia japonica]|uniref:uncharacterized protein LOC117100821 n=1 Tax=Anneissia japonica TaxID=1529436 RepID=UPI0014258FC5|nr:uncharacterized protein LOC117100821 [Anneissia japonica]